MTKRWLILSLFLTIGCLPHPKSNVQKARPELTIKGRVLHSSETLSGRTVVYVERSAVPETLTDDEGNFVFSFDEDRLEALQRQHGLQNSRLHLYFESENGNPESAVIDDINIQYRGEMNLGSVQLQAETQVAGRVIAAGSAVPMENARIWLGRKEFISAIDGSFRGTIPAATSTPFLVEKKGFVQTKGTWLAGGLEREVELYGDLAPTGTIVALPHPRATIGNTLISLSYSATSTAHWVRFANSAGTLNQIQTPEAPWMDLSKPLQIAAADVIFYQFADKDQKIFGPILSYSPPVAEE